MGTFVWLTAFVYRQNIRGYVPAGITGLSFLGIATVLLLIYLSGLARRYNQRFARYILGGFLGVPLALVISSFYTSSLAGLLGYSLNKDIAISSIGAILFTSIAIGLRRFHVSALQMQKNQKSQPT